MSFHPIATQMSHAETESHVIDDVTIGKLEKLFIRAVSLLHFTAVRQTQSSVSFPKKRMALSLSSLVLAVVLILTVSSCGLNAAVTHVRSSSEPISMNPVLPSPGSLSASVNDFSFALFHRLSQENDQKNVFVSPFSVSTALSILLLGARSSSADELTKTLAFDKIDTSNGKNVHQLFAEVSYIT
jgi:hypothetical protein